MLKSYNVVTNQNVIHSIKKSQYFRINLGMAVSMEKNGERILSDKDQFSISYNYQYKTIIYAQGNIGNIRFYLDYGITDDKIAVYYELEEFLFDYDKTFIIEKGIDAFVGFMLKSVDDQYKEMMKRNREKSEERVQKVGNSEMLIKNPGSVTYEDVKKYMQERKS